MNKEEARKRLEEIKEEQEKLQAIIDKPDRWQDGLAQPDKEKHFFIAHDSWWGLTIDSNSRFGRKPEHAFKTREQAELIKEKMLLMQEMYAFAHVRNEGWLPDWSDSTQNKWGLSYNGSGQLRVFCGELCNDYIFGIVAKSVEIAEEMLEEFGERIEKFYNKMY